MQPKVSVADILEARRLQTPEAQHEAQEAQYKQAQLQQLSSIEQTMNRAVKGLISYLDGKVTKTEVVNQLKEIGTPDAMKVVTAVNELHATLKTHKNTDLSEVTTVMRSVLDEAKKIPKELPKIPEHKETDYTVQFKSLTDAIKGVEKVVKAQKLIAEAPIVNVPEAKINVAPPNLLPLQSSISEVVAAVKAIVIPEYKTDNAKVEKLLEKSNKLLKELLDKPMGGGFASGGMAAFRNSTGNVDQVQLDADGKVPVNQRDFDYLSITNSNTDEDTLVYKTGGSSGTTLRTLVITYATGAEKISDSIASLDYS